MDLPPEALPAATVKPFRWRPWSLAIIIICLVGYFFWHSPFTLQAQRPKTVIIGLDGLEPKLVEAYAQAGKLPHFAEFIKNNRYHHLRTSNPAQSPVSWSSFTSGSNPGQHGIFDFLRRDPKTYLPDLALIREEVGGNSITIGDWELPLSGTRFAPIRNGPEFWQLLEQHDVPTRILHVPVTFPPSGSRRMISGMGVPDIQGTQGTFTFYTEETVAGKDIGGRVQTISFNPRTAQAEVFGPTESDSAKPVIVPLSIAHHLDFNGTKSAISITTGDTTMVLTEGEWSGWVNFVFPINFYTSVSAIGRFHLASLDPVGLYLSPLQFAPHDPVAPISIPEDYASELADELGPYHTLGMPEETWALNEGRIDEDAFLAQVGTILQEQEDLLTRELKTFDSGLLVWVTMTSDRIQHMFWRTIDKQHPLYTPELAERYGSVIEHMYIAMDALVGRIQAQLEPEDTLIVMSDHGFSSFRRAAHINSYLMAHGLLTLNDGHDTSAEFFQQVDWTRTQAYALGLGGIYLNLRGRERNGVVAPGEEANALKHFIIAALHQWRDGDNQVVLNVYDSARIYQGPFSDESPDLLVGFAEGYRTSWQTALGAVPEVLCEDNLKKWSGDHCIDPTLVPGVLFCSRPLTRSNPAIEDIAPTLLKSYQVIIPEEMDGQPLW